MSGHKYFILHLTKAGQERLGFAENPIYVWDYAEDKEATELDGRLWYKARLDNEKNLFLHIRHDEIKTSEEAFFVIEQSSNSNSSDNCFITTACSANYYELDILYQFRDKYLVNFRLGKKFIEFYYTFSPSIADVIRESSLLKKLTLPLFIKPLVFTINLLFDKHD